MSEEEKTFGLGLDRRVGIFLGGKLGKANPDNANGMRKGKGGMGT